MATDTKASESASPDKLHELITSANLQYSLKNYDEAAEIYSQATEIQAEANGEMSPENAELLYLYGRCLFKVAVSKSDVLGGQVASEKKKAEPAKKAKKPVEEAIAEVAESKAVGSKEKTVANQPFFQITGDENWDTDSDDEDTAEAEAGPAEEDDDDFATAYEILDVARVLYVKQLEALEADPANSIEDKGKGKATGELATLSPETRHVKERLADTHDLQAEISLENERFHDAINDSRASLVLRQEIFPKESEMIAEAHYKLALALEFASVTSVREAEEADKPVAVQESDIDQKMRDEAAEHMEAAIESCRARVASEEKKLESLTGDEAKEKKRGIVDVNEIIQDMKQRLVELRSPAISLAGSTGGPQADAIGGLLAQVLGQSAGEQKARIEEATKNANDLTGLVKKKPKAQPSNGTTQSASSSNGKRKLEDDAESSEEKKTKV